MSFDVDPRERMIAALKRNIETYREQSVLDAIALGDKDDEIERLTTAYGDMMARYCEANAKITTQEMEIIALGTDNGRLRTDYSVLKQDYDAQRNALQSLLDEVMCFVVDPPSAALNHAIEEAGRAMEPKP